MFKKYISNIAQTNKFHKFFVLLECVLLTALLYISYLFLIELNHSSEISVYNSMMGTSSNIDTINVVRLFCSAFTAVFSIYLHITTSNSLPLLIGCATLIGLQICIMPTLIIMLIILSMLFLKKHSIQ